MRRLRGSATACSYGAKSKDWLFMKILIAFRKAATAIRSDGKNKVSRSQKIHPLLGLFFRTRGERPKNGTFL